MVEIIKEFRWYLTADDTGHYEATNNLDTADVLLIIDNLVKRFSICREALMMTLFGKPIESVHATLKKDYSVQVNPEQLK